MNQNHLAQQLEVFRAQTENVRALQLAWSDINRQINAAILAKNQRAIISFTRILAIVYCALAEAIFSKIIHTPHGLSLDGIEQIKAKSNANGVKSGWSKCAELSLRSVEGKGNHAPNVKKKLDTLIDKYVFDPSLIRNKIAHGQWSIALNRENTAKNVDLTREIERLDVVELYRRKNALERLSAILEDIIESPKKAHPRDYWQHMVEFEAEQEKMQAWTIEKKINSLFRKKSFSKSERAPQ